MQPEKLEGIYLLLIMEQSCICEAAKSLCEKYGCAEITHFNKKPPDAPLAGSHYSHNHAMLKLELNRHVPEYFDRVIVVDNDLLIVHQVRGAVSVFTVRSRMNAS
jgi:hypothetical protein